MTSVYKRPKSRTAQQSLKELNNLSNLSMLPMLTDDTLCRLEQIAPDGFRLLNMLHQETKHEPNFGCWVFFTLEKSDSSNSMDRFVKFVSIDSRDSIVKCINAVTAMWMPCMIFHLIGT